MSSFLVGDDSVSDRLRAVLTSVDGDLAHLRELRAAGTSADQAERELRTRGEHQLRSAHARRDPLDGDAEAC